MPADHSPPSSGDMVGCMGVLDNARRGPRTGGEVVRGHIAQTTGGEDPYVFSYRRLEVHAYVLPEPVPHVLYCTYGKSRVESSQPAAGTQTELTLRVRGTPALPDEWPARLLARAARDDIEPGHYLVLDNPRATVCCTEGHSRCSMATLGCCSIRSRRQPSVRATMLSSPPPRSSPTSCSQYSTRCRASTACAPRRWNSGW